MTADEVIDDLKDEMRKTLDAFRQELSRIRSGRATTALLDGILPEYYGTRTALNQIATVSVPEPRLIIVQPFDRQALTAIEKAIQQSDLGLNPLNDGKILRLPIPDLTEERRKEIVRQVRKKTEDYRVSVRGHRHDALEMLKEMCKEKELTEDDQHRAKDRVEGEVKEILERVGEMLKAKEKEVRTV